jgi:hypothetical protein
VSRFIHWYLWGSTLFLSLQSTEPSQELPDVAEIVRLLQQDAIEDRVKAETVLAKYGPALLKPLESLSTTTTSVEVRERVQRIVREIHRARRVESLRAKRARLPEGHLSLSPEEIAAQFLSPLGLTNVAIHNSARDLRLNPTVEDPHFWKCLDATCKNGNLVVQEGPKGVTLIARGAAPLSATTMFEGDLETHKVFIRRIPAESQNTRLVIVVRAPPGEMVMGSTLSNVSLVDKAGKELPHRMDFDWVDPVWPHRKSGLPGYFKSGSILVENGVVDKIITIRGQLSVVVPDKVDLLQVDLGARLAPATHTLKNEDASIEVERVAVNDDHEINFSCQVNVLGKQNVRFVFWSETADYRWIADGLPANEEPGTVGLDNIIPGTKNVNPKWLIVGIIRSIRRVGGQFSAQESDRYRWNVP